jgi:hypothetical protein
LSDSIANTKSQQITHDGGLFPVFRLLLDLLLREPLLGRRLSLAVRLEKIRDPIIVGCEPKPLPGSFGIGGSRGCALAVSLRFFAVMRSCAHRVSIQSQAQRSSDLSNDRDGAARDLATKGRD